MDTREPFDLFPSMLLRPSPFPSMGRVVIYMRGWRGNPVDLVHSGRFFLLFAKHFLEDRKPFDHTPTFFALSLPFPLSVEAVYFRVLSGFLYVWQRVICTLDRNPPLWLVGLVESCCATESFDFKKLSWIHQSPL